MNKYRKVFNNLKSTEGTLSQKVVRSGFWVFLLRIINRGFSLLRLVILARLLLPADFGLMGIALLTLSILETFTQTGFQSALIQKKDDIQPYLDTAWTFLILRGIILYSILYLIAPYAAFFFDTPKAGPIIRAIGVVLIFNALTNIGIIYFKKELEFYKEFIYQFSGTMVDFIVAVTAVLILKNVWALVLGSIAGSFVSCIVSYFVHPYRPKIRFDFAKAKELFGFGKWIMGSSILIFLITHVDDIFVGKFIGTTALGFYQLAYRISNMPATEITHVISQVTFPAYSKLQNNMQKLRETYLRVLQLTAFLSFPIAGLIFILAPDFTIIFLGEKWLPIVLLIKILCFQAIARSISGVLGTLVTGIGRPNVITKIGLLQLLMVALMIFPLSIKYGVSGVAMCMVFQSLVTFPILLKVTLVKINFGVPQFLKVLFYPFIFTFIIVIILLILNYSFIIEIFLGVAIYLILVYAGIKFRLFSEVFANLKYLIKNIF